MNKARLAYYIGQLNAMAIQQAPNDKQLNQALELGQKITYEFNRKTQVPFSFINLANNPGIDKKELIKKLVDLEIEPKSFDNAEEENLADWFNESDDSYKKEKFLNCIDAAMFEEYEVEQ